MKVYGWSLSLLLSIQVNAQKSPVNLFPREAIHISSGIFKNAEETDTRYILALNMDRLLAPYLREAGLIPKAASYENWENTGLDGHIGGHYLSALSSMYAATGNVVLKERLLYMLSELKKCQDQHQNGYLGGIPNSKALWQEIAEGKIEAQLFSLNNRWVPWYNIHKMYAGLYDAWQYAHLTEAKEMLLKLADWWINISKNLTNEQLENMLTAEFGGMNEAFANIYKISPKPVYLAEANRFAHRKILQPLLNAEDRLNGLHANTQIPKVIGYQQIAQLTNDESLFNASDFFWNNVVSKRSVIIGGNSVREHFHPVNNYTEMLLSKEGPETCNTYNMLKLSRLLYNMRPSTHYIDYYENATYNHILSTQHPSKGGFVYFTPMRPQHYRLYSQPQEGFWCCVGSGLENHSKYGEFIYTHTKETLFINLFIPSTLEWKEKNIAIKQETQFPYSSQSVVHITKGSKQKFTVAIRQPAWLAGQMDVLVNGKKINNPEVKNNYLLLNRKWKKGDKISFTLPMTVTAEKLPDNSPWVAFRYGPIVLSNVSKSLAGDSYFGDNSRMGHIANGTLVPIDATPSIPFKPEEAHRYILKKDSTQLHFSMQLPGSDEEYILQPFYSIHEARYTLYWPTAGEGNSSVQQAEQEMLLINQTTVDRIILGEQQPESDHGFTYEQSKSGIYKDVHWRNTLNYIAYLLHNKNNEGKSLVIRYLDEPGANTFQVYFNNELLSNVQPEQAVNAAVKTISFPLNHSKMQELKDRKIPVRISALHGKETPKIFEIRLSKE